MSSGGDSEEYEEEVQIEEEEDSSQAQAPKQIPKQMVVQDDKDPYNGTFVFYDEDHTLGNSLRYILCNNNNVEFCGYSLPHPSENRMNVRLQTLNETKDHIMNEGLKTLEAVCDIIEQKFKQALE